MANVNWEQIKFEYVTTDVSQRELSRKYGISLSTIGHRSKVEGWVSERERYRGKVATKTLNKTAERESNRLARLIDTTNRAVGVVEKAFADEQQFNRYVVSEATVPGCSEVSEKIFAKVDTKALKDLTAVLKDLTGLMRDFYNIPTPAEAEAQRIAAERLNLDKVKAEANKDTAADIEVIFAAGEEAWNE